MRRTAALLLLLCFVAGVAAKDAKTCSTGIEEENPDAVCGLPNLPFLAARRLMKLCRDSLSTRKTFGAAAEAEGVSRRAVLRRESAPYTPPNRNPSDFQVVRERG